MLPVSCQGPVRLTVHCSAVRQRGAYRDRALLCVYSAVCACRYAVAVCWAGLAGLIPRPSTFFSRLAILSTTVYKASWIRFVDIES